MKTPAFIAVLAFLVLAGAAGLQGQTVKGAFDDRWLARDKASHLALSAALVGFTYHLMRYEQQETRASSRNLALGLSLGMGMAKETRDGSFPPNRFSYKDLAADLLGAGLGMIIFTTK